MAKEALTATSRMELGNDGILRIVVHKGARFELEQMIVHYEVAHRLAGKYRVPVLVDASAQHSISRKAQEYAAAQSHTRLATALVANNPLTRLLTNIYISVFRPVSPLKLFSSIESAENWLRDQMLEEEFSNGRRVAS
jgi:hypothetical protein